MTEQSSIANPKLRCTHTHPAGHRCGSYSIRGEQFCFHHHPERPPARRPRRNAAHEPFRLPVIMDRRSIQIAFAEVALRIASNTIDLKRAGMLLQCLQIAAATHTI